MGGGFQPTFTPHGFSQPEFSGPLSSCWSLLHWGHRIPLFVYFPQGDHRLLANTPRPSSPSFSLNSRERWYVLAGRTNALPGFRLPPKGAVPARGAHLSGLRELWPHGEPLQAVFATVTPSKETPGFSSGNSVNLSSTEVLRKREQISCSELSCGLICHLAVFTEAAFFLESTWGVWRTVTGISSHVSCLVVHVQI